MPPTPVLPPIGLRLARTARVVTHAFERAMADAGGSTAAWQVLLLVRSKDWGIRARHDERLRPKLTDEETLLLAELLGKLQAGLQDDDAPPEPAPTAPA